MALIGEGPHWAAADSLKSEELTDFKEPRSWVGAQWCRRQNADFEAWDVQSGWIRAFGLLRSHKTVKSLNMLGVRQRCANRRRDGRFSQTNASKESSAPCLICWLCIFCSNECDLREISGILDCGTEETCFLSPWPWLESSTASLFIHAALPQSGFFFGQPFPGQIKCRSIQWKEFAYLYCRGILRSGCILLNYLIITGIKVFKNCIFSRHSISCPWSLSHAFWNWTHNVKWSLLLTLHASNICDAEAHAKILNTCACVRMQPRRMYMHTQVRLSERYDGCKLITVDVYACTSTAVWALARVIDAS